MQETAWLLLIYTVPSQPSRKRAAVWRELKKLGATYLRDGVAALPAVPRLADRLEAIAKRIEEYEGTADLVQIAPLRASRQAAILAQFQEERSAEYRELYHACVRFLRDVLQEVETDDFGFPDVGNLESELSRLTRYYEQIRERDYFGAVGADRVDEILRKCERAFEHFTSTASDRGAGEERESPTDDVFQRLGGPAGEPGDAEHDLPI
jgi:hypothetical protein